MSWQHGLFLRVLCLGAGYLFGCFLTAEIVARCTAGCSAREIGTGNPGMANIATHLGKKAGLLVLLAGRAGAGPHSPFVRRAGGCAGAQLAVLE